MSCIEYYIAVSFPDILRAIFGPLPYIICSLEIISKNVYLIQLFVILDAILIAKFIFIFKLKNPLGFNDEFWSTFVTVWIRVLCWIPQMVVFLLPGKNTLSWYICLGTEPPTEDLPLSKKLTPTIVYLISAWIHFYIPLRIKLFKMKKPAPEVGVTIRFRNGNKMEHLVNLTNSITTFAFTALTALFIWISNVIGPKELQIYPGYLFEYFYRFCWPPIFFGGFAVLYYVRHASLRHFVLDYIKSIFNKNNIF